jgi:hypothetical protein
MQAIPRDYNRKSKLPSWFSNTLRYYNDKKMKFLRRFKKKREITFVTYSWYTKSLLKTLSCVTGFYDAVKW